jgi:nucleoid-associated protein YgaU
MSNGNKVAIVAFGILAVGIISYYGLQNDPSDAGAQVPAADGKAPAPAPAPANGNAKVNGNDPAITADNAQLADDDLAKLIERRRERRVVSVDQPVNDMLQIDLLNPASQVATAEQTPKATGQLEENKPMAKDGQPAADDKPTADVPQEKHIGRQPIDQTNVEVQPKDVTTTDHAKIAGPTDAAAADASQVRPVPHDVLVQKAPADATPPDTRVEDEVLTAKAVGDDEQDAAPPANQYTVKSGDSMWVISKRTLGAGHKWQLIADANPQIDPNNLQPGQTLTIPELDKPKDDAAAAADAGPVARKTTEDPLGLGLNTNIREVVVMDGESLWTIAQREYKDGTKWYFLWQANKDRMKSKDALRPGQKLRVPPLPEEN